jgi:2-iminobutanoate/2-iminopropanoate deaminase
VITVCRSGLILVACGVLGACSIQERTDRDPDVQVSPRRQIIQPEGVARLPFFSSAVRSGDLIFLSGALGALPGVSPPQLIEGGIEAETRQTLENIISVLDAAGATLADLIKCTIYLADIDEYAAMNTIYAEYFTSEPPARAAMAGSGLAFGARVEIECIAAAPEGS